MSDTFGAALDAFAGAGLAPDTQDLPDETNQPLEVSTQEVTPEPTVDLEPNVPASKEVDLSGLPEEAQIFLRAREREMQADYTRKTQEVARQREEAEQYTQFVNALNSDPQFALEVVNRLQAQLEQAGLYQRPQADEYYGTYDDDDPAPGPDPYEKKLQELEARQRAWEEQAYNAWEEARVDREVAEIRSQNPAYSDVDVQDIVDLGWATNGDLHAAHDLYKGIQDRVLARYLQTKKGVQAPSPVSGGSGSPVPDDLRTADQMTLRKAAEERLINAIAQ